jgi:hypothetical protein
MKIVDAIYMLSNRRLPWWTLTRVSSSRERWSTKGMRCESSTQP